MGATIKQTHFEPLPTGEYQARIGALGLEDGQFGTQAVFRFDVMTPGYEGRTVKGWASATFSPKSKLYKWTQAAFGRDIPPEYDLVLDHLLDRVVTLVIVTKEGDDGGEYNKIDSVKAARRNGGPAPAAADDRGVVQQRAPLTAANARAGVVATQPSSPAWLRPGAGVPVNTTAPVPEDVPAWLNDDGAAEGQPF